MDFVAKNLSSDDYNVKMGFVGDYICAICDEGGELIGCDGICGRWFHPSIDTGRYAECKTLELSGDDMNLSQFVCKNCKYHQHQCFVCGKLGSSEKFSVLEKVFQCCKQNCQQFYHWACLPSYCQNITSPQFECPMHECFSCKNNKGKVTSNSEEGKVTSNSEGLEMRLVVCRRCPIAYHQTCLPSEISDTANGRLYEIEGRPFFYCVKHEKTTDHLKFPKELPFDINVTISNKET